MERRAVTRRVPFADEPLSRVRLRTGRELLVVNVSNTGLLVEGTVRLLPGTHVDVHVVTPDGRVLVRSRIVRAYVFDVQPDIVRYRGALAFDRTIDTATAGYGVHGVFGGLSDPLGTAYPGAVRSTPHAGDQRLIA